MSTSDKFFQFPIAALRLGKPITEVDDDEMNNRLHEIVRFCVIEVGTSMLRSKDYDLVQAMADRQAVSQGIERDEENEKQTILLVGACQLNVKLGSLDWKVQHASHKLVRDASLNHGSQQCRLRAEFLWEAVGAKWTWRELSTLCAVYAGIGSHKRAKLTYDRIGAMALGFNGQRERDANGEATNQLTDRQTQWTVNRLRDCSLFVCASPNRRHVFYSHRMALNELIENLAESAVEKSKVSAKSITEAIQTRTKELAKKRAAI